MRSPQSSYTPPSAIKQIQLFIYSKPESEQSFYRNLFRQHLKLLHDHSPMIPSPIGGSPSLELAFTIIRGQSLPKSRQRGTGELDYRKFVLYRRHNRRVVGEDQARKVRGLNDIPGEFDREIKNFLAAQSRISGEEPSSADEDQVDRAVAIYNEIAMIDQAFDEMVNMETEEEPAEEFHFATDVEYNMQDEIDWFQRRPDGEGEGMELEEEAAEVGEDAIMGGTESSDHQAEP